jgi:hypothetical protein
MLVIITAYTIDQSLRLASRRWEGPLSAALILTVAIAVKIVMEW